jgi:hypothetical protein
VNVTGFLMAVSAMVTTALIVGWVVLSAIVLDHSVVAGVGMLAAPFLALFLFAWAVFSE